MTVKKTSKAIHNEDTDALLNTIDNIRLEANSRLDESKRGQLGQFMTPAPVAKLIASMFNDLSGDISLLDAGAGVGSLTAALVDRTLKLNNSKSITSTAYEIEPILIDSLRDSLGLLHSKCKEHSVNWHCNIISQDFIENAVQLIKARENGVETLPTFNKAILNPPYLKISAKGRERTLLREVGIETGNLYSAFVSLAIMLLEPGGELVAITPRSFCNGPYFRSFRQLIHNETAIKKIQIFNSRTKSFKGDKVLQENIIFHLIKNEKQVDIEITSRTCVEDEKPIVRKSSATEVANPNNPEGFIHIITSDEEANLATKIDSLPCSLDDLDIGVSTGRVVDFRTRKNLRQEPGNGTAPLIYPLHFSNGKIKWPIENARKPNALANNASTEMLMVPNGTYVLTKRLTAKEENRRVVAAIYTPDTTDSNVVGFENKTNYFHSNGASLNPLVALGLCRFLNSTIVDKYFRQFNGHTQVNATDLRFLRYPNLKQLKKIGNKLKNKELTQKDIDNIVEETIFASL